MFKLRCLFGHKWKYLKAEVEGTLDNKRRVKSTYTPHRYCTRCLRSQHYLDTSVSGNTIWFPSDQKITSLVIETIKQQEEESQQCTTI